MSFDNRKQVIESLKYVSKVIKQETLSYIPNLTLIQPDYVVHGDDWQMESNQVHGRVLLMHYLNGEDSSLKFHIQPVSHQPL